MNENNNIEKAKWKTSSRKVFEMFNDQNKHLYELSLRKEQFSEYSEKNTAGDIVNSLGWEVEELLVELNEYNNSNLSIEEKEKKVNKIQWELKDVIYMLNSSMIKMDQLWLLDWFENFWKEQKDKIISRAPHLKQCEKIPLDVEKKVWKILKNKESK